MALCSVCRNELTSPASGGFAVCGKCGAPQFFGDPASPFEILGVSRSYALDEKALEGRYYELSKLLHPDRYAAAGGIQARLKSQELAAYLNQAYLSLRSPEPRLEALLRSAGALGKTEERSVKPDQVPAELAEEYFELQEALMEDDDRAAALIADFRRKLETKRRALDDELRERTSRVDWNAPAAPELEKILELRRQRSYVRSMFQNLERICAGNG